jgi:hypothetical protein
VVPVLLRVMRRYEDGEGEQRGDDASARLVDNTTVPLHIIPGVAAVGTHGAEPAAVAAATEAAPADHVRFQFG